LKILIFHTGSLGDTLVAIPAFRAVRKYFPTAHISLLTDQQSNIKVVNAYDILKDTGFVDSYMHYKFFKKSWNYIRIIRTYWSLFLMLRRRKYDALIYLKRFASMKKIVFIRDISFFRLAGIRSVYGLPTKENLQCANMNNSVYQYPHQTDLLLARLSASGIQIPAKKDVDPKLPISMEDKKCIDIWVSSQTNNDANNGYWIAVGPGTKKPVNQWPIDRYVAVLNKLIQNYDVWPVVFGGPEDQQTGMHIISSLFRGYNTAGIFSIPQSIAAMQKCLFYLGNDTGTMHMAVAAGIPCVAIFSAHNYPGAWEPYGDGHIVLRKQIDCEFCRLKECPERKNECIMSISIDEVYVAASQMLSNCLQICHLR